MNIQCWFCVQAKIKAEEEERLKREGEEKKARIEARREQKRMEREVRTD
jgi:hypothetical protein